MFAKVWHCRSVRIELCKPPPHTKLGSSDRLLPRKPLGLAAMASIDPESCMFTDLKICGLLALLNS